MSVFSGGLKKELDTLERVLKLRFRETDVARAMSNKRLTLCIDISTKAIDMAEAIEKTRLLRYRSLYCEKSGSPEPSALAKVFARQRGLTRERDLLAIRRFCSQTSGTVAFSEKYSHIHELESEFFCIREAELMDMLPYFASDDTRDFPPVARVHAIGKDLCERLKKREISVEDARYELEAARLMEREKFGDYGSLKWDLAYSAWSAGRMVSDEHPYYWGFMFLAGVALWIVFFPLYLIGARGGWHWMEAVSTGVLSTYCSVAVLSMLFQLDLDDYSKIFGLMATIGGIVVSVIGAAIGLKKLLGKSRSE